MRIGNSKKFEIQGLKFDIQKIKNNFEFQRLKSKKFRNTDIPKVYKQHSISRIL